MPQFFAVAAPGLETLTALELRRLGLVGESAASTQAEPGGVTFRGELEELYRANLHLRTASRVLVRLGSFRATSFAELRKKAGRLEWGTYLSPGQPVALRVSCHKSKLYHSDAVAERLAGAIADRLGRPVERSKPADDDQENPAQLILARLSNDECSVSIDSSGELLHRRGYRQALAKAPLRETLAAGLLLACGWEGQAPLLDPFCGSGTIPIEAALLACGVPPGAARRFAFMDWPGYQAEAWQALLDASAQQADVRVPPIQASDRDAGAVRMAQANAERAGVADRIEFSCRAVSAVEPPESPGWVVTNPPYGLRVSQGRDVRNLYAQFGNVLRAKCPGWQLGVLCNDPRLLGQIGLRLDTSLALINGGISVRLARGQVAVR